MKTNEQNKVTSTIDDLSRVLIPHSLRLQLNWETGMKLTFAVSQEALEFSAHQGGAFALDDFGRITISQDLMETMGWKVGEKVTILPLEICNGVAIAQIY